MKKITLCFIFISLFLGVSAQADFIKGYLLLKSNDTIWGYIKDSPNYMLTETVQIVPAYQTQQVDYNADQIKSFCFVNNKCFESIEFTDKNNISAKNFQCVVKGKISLYILNEKGGRRFFIRTGNMEFTELYETFRGPGDENKSNHEYILPLKKAMEDNTAFYQRIDNLKFDIAYLQGLIYDYNNESDIANSEKYRISYRYAPKLIVYSGVGVYLVSGSGYIGGLGLQLYSSEASRHFALHLGINYRSFSYGNVKGDFDIQFPISIAYEFARNHKLPRPYVGVTPTVLSGISSMNDRYYNFATPLNLGLNYNISISNKINLYTDFSYSDFHLHFLLGIQISQFFD